MHIGTSSYFLQYLRSQIIKTGIIFSMENTRKDI